MSLSPGLVPSNYLFEDIPHNSVPFGPRYPLYKTSEQADSGRPPFPMLLDPSVNAERREMLDRLNELEALRGFREIDMTPTTVVTSLPTPLEEHASFTETIQVPPDTPSPLRSALGLESLIELKPPPAPLIKDLDSFTDGTGIGSFDSIPAGSTNEVGEPIPALSRESLERLPPHNLWLSINDWRVDVFSCEQPEDTTCPSSSSTTKRPRSPAQDDGDERMRPRGRIASPSSFRASSISICSSAAEDFSIHEPFEIPTRPRSAPPG